MQHFPTVIKYVGDTSCNFETLKSGWVKQKQLKLIQKLNVFLGNQIS